jgi:hypothetical protein
MFSCVTGADFARSIRWARKQPPNVINQAIKEFLMSTATKTEIKLITPARFFAGGGDYSLPALHPSVSPEGRTHSIIHPAEIEYNGIRLFSEVPNSAAKAEKINTALRT